METMFDTLLQLPLFQGMSHEDFTSILGKVKLHFSKHNPGEVLAQRGEPCNRLIFLLKGDITSTLLPDDESYSLSERFSAPWLIEPHSMFGMHTSYTSTYTADTEVHTVCISKSFVMKELLGYEIFRLNYLNIVSNRAQLLHKRTWEFPTDNIEARITHFILCHTERSTGEKALKISTEKLASLINETRAGVAKALNALQEKGIIEWKRGEIKIKFEKWKVESGK